MVDTRYHIVSRTPYKYTKKTGRPPKSNVSTGLPLTKEVLGRFEEFKEEIVKGHEKTIHNAYFGMCEKYYSEPLQAGDTTYNLLPISERPTYDQFYYYCRKNITKEMLLKAKLGETETFNSHRLLTGRSRTGTGKAGDICECDALEADFYIVSELDPTQNVGKPIVYMMIDAFTSNIVAVSVSYENNSFVGLTNLMLNLGMDKVEFAKQYGITINPDQWRSCILPTEIRCDRGSDFKSDKFGKVCDRLGIQRNLVTGATGSMKGIIEQCFHQFQQRLRPHLESKGLINYRYNKHKKEAMIDMYTFTQLLIQFVIAQNERNIINYPMQKYMHQIPNFKPIPAFLWEYSVKKYGPPKQITSANRIQYIYDLMIEQTATVSRYGLCLSHLTYINSKDPDLIDICKKAGKKKEKFPVRCDPRDVSRLYYMKGNELNYAELNPNIIGNTDYKGMSWLQYKEYYNNLKKHNRNGKKENLNVDFRTYQIFNWIIDNAIKVNYANTTNIKKARSIAKNAHNTNNNLFKQITNTQQTNQTTTNQNTTNLTTNTPNQTMNNQVVVNTNNKTKTKTKTTKNNITQTEGDTIINTNSVYTEMDYFFDTLDYIGNDVDNNTNTDITTVDNKNSADTKLNENNDIQTNITGPQDNTIVSEINVDISTDDTNQTEDDEFTPCDDLRDALEDFE